MISTHQIWKIYGTQFKEMTKELLDKTDLAAHIRMTCASRSEPCIGIKPNLVCPTPASYGATTHPEIIAGIIEYLQGHRFSNLLITESSWVGDRTSEAYEYCGYRTLCETYGVPFIDAQKEKSHSVNCAGMTLQIVDVTDRIDYLINVPVLKGHCQTRITCALKNMKGLLPNQEKRRFHQMGLHQPIAHLSAAVKGDFIVIDHICGDLTFEEGGNPVVKNCIMAALDPVLTDSYTCWLMGYTPDDVPYIRLAEQLGSGTTDLDSAEIIRIQNPFSREDAPAENDRFPEEPDHERPLAHQVLSVAYAVNEVDSCSACYANLVPALIRLEEEGLLTLLPDKIAIGQGHQGKTGALGVGKCTRGYDFCVMGCPPEETAIYEKLKQYILSRADG